MTIVYNPKYFGQKESVKVSDIFEGAMYEIEPNSMVSFDNDILAQYLLKKFSFLEKIEPKNVAKIRKLIESPVLPKAIEEVSEKDKEAISGVTPAIPVGFIKGARKSRKLTPEEAEGITSSEFYGPGLEDDTPSPMQVQRTVGRGGVFGAQ